MRCFRSTNDSQHHRHRHPRRRHRQHRYHRHHQERHPPHTCIRTHTCATARSHHPPATTIPRPTGTPTGTPLPSRSESCVPTLGRPALGDAASSPDAPPPQATAHGAGAATTSASPAGRAAPCEAEAVQDHAARRPVGASGGGGGGEARGWWDTPPPASAAAPPPRPPPPPSATAVAGEDMRHSEEQTSGERARREPRATKAPAHRCQPGWLPSAALSLKLLAWLAWSNISQHATTRRNTPKLFTSGTQ